MYEHETSGTKRKAGSVDGGWSSIVQRLMRTHVVVLVDVVCDTSAEFSFGRVFFNVDLLGFQAAEPPFDHDVVRPARLSVHALSDVQRLEQGLIVIAGELAALVGIDDCRNAVTFHCLTDCFQHRGSFQGVGQLPPHDLAAVPVDDCSQVHVAALHLDVGDVDRPHLVRKLRHVVSEQVRQESFLIVPLRGVRLGVYRIDRHLAHVLLDRLPTYKVPVIAQQNTDFPRTPSRILGMPVVDERHDPLFALDGFLIRGLGRVVHLRADYAQKLALSPD